MMKPTKRTTIQVSQDCKDALAALGNKGDTYEDIIMDLIHQRNILMIHELCKGQNLDDFDLKARCESVFHIIRFESVPPFSDGVELKEWDSFESALNWAVEMGCDEDMIGNCRENPPMGEVVTNVYCLMNDIPSPTTNPVGAMRNPFSI